MGEIDVLVVGSGAAGMLAAVVAAEAGQKTVMVTKGQAARSGATATITGDCCVDGRTCVELLGLKADHRDTQDAFFEDTVAGGKYLNDQHLVEAMVSEIGPIVKRMRDSGLRIGDPIRAPGHRTARGVWISGMELMQTLRKLMIKLDVKVREEFFATDLLLNDGAVAGIAGIDQRTGDVVALRAKAVVLATSNREYNVTWESLPADQLPHSDHRFECTRQELRDWANRIARQHAETGTDQRGLRFSRGRCFQRG